MKRGLLLLSTVFIAAALVPAAIADPPDRQTVDEYATIADQCAFPVLAHVEGDEILRNFLDKSDDLVKQLGVFPGQTSTWTNLETGKSITVSDAGSYHVRYATDGSGTLVINGHGPVPPFLIAGRGIWYLDGGQITATADSDGNLTSVVFRGNLVDLCTRLAP